MRYRIRLDALGNYEAQRKGWFFWHTLPYANLLKTLQQAEDAIAAAIHEERHEARRRKKSITIKWVNSDEA